MSARQPLNIDALLVNDVTATLAADNARAEREASERDWKEQERIVRKHGFSNTVGVLADIADTMGQEHPEQSGEALDYEQAREVLEAAAAGVDLTYGCNPGYAKARREKALENMHSNLREF